MLSAVLTFYRVTSGGNKNHTPKMTLILPSTTLLPKINFYPPFASIFLKTSIFPWLWVFWCIKGLLYFSKHSSLSFIYWVFFSNLYCFLKMQAYLWCTGSFSMLFLTYLSNSNFYLLNIPLLFRISINI